MDIEKQTGTRDEHYNLISVLYHQLQQAETCEQYIQDAQEAGDEPLADFFRQCQEQARSLAERGKELMQARMVSVQAGVAEDDIRADRSSEESFPASDSPAY